MCNHYRLDARDIQMFKDWEDIGLPPVWAEDIYPKGAGLVARLKAGSKIFEAMHWGFPRTVPGKRPGTTKKTTVTNVRNLSSPYWKSMLANPAQRCLVPFSQFAEPKIGQGRAEHWFRILDRPVAAVAGIWRPTEVGNTFAFLTCEPNPLVAPLHPKAMPVILHEADYAKWLTCDFDEACGMAVPFPSQLMSVA